MTDTKTLAERLRGLSDYLIHAGEDEASSLVDQAADALERITPPDAGVGLKRYVIGAVMLKGEPALFTCEGPVGPDEGEWVRYEAAEARCDTLAGALRSISDHWKTGWASDNDGDLLPRSAIITKVERIANAALATIPAKPATETKP